MRLPRSTNAVVWLLASMALLGFPGVAAPQAEVAAWGNLEGIRVDGHRFAFETGVCLQRADGSEMVRTSKERQRPRYTRESPSLRGVTSSLGGIRFREVVEDVGRGVASVDLTVVADTQGIPARTTLCLDLPIDVYTGGRAEWISDSGGPDTTQLAADGGATNTPVRAASGVRFIADSQQVEIRFASPTQLSLGRSQRNGGSIRLVAELLPESPAPGDSVRLPFMVAVDGSIDHAPVRVEVQSSRPGRAFDGLGGNFRLQNAQRDPQVIEYNLENMRVAWGRVELPWRHWHPEEALDPLAEARAGRADPRVLQAMEMARDLSLRGMPVVVAVWFPPDWAIVGGGEIERAPGAPPGDPLDPAKMERIYDSLADYLVFMKEAYGVEAAMFSFNESDLGIDVRQTAEEHAALIRGLGAYFGERDLATGMLLGDTSDATAMDFILPTMSDPEALRYVDAVSFHSWRGWSDEILSYWGEAARQLNVPLLVGEGSTDAGAWRYPAIFQEPAFAREEIQLYIRMMALAQPLSILQWQLTSDYSLLAGGGVFGDSSELRPTQRFWNLKQLAASPSGFHLPTTCDHPRVSCAAVGNIAAGEYAVHLVNDGAAREAAIVGLQPEITRLQVVVTDAERGMESLGTVPVVNGVARVDLPAVSFVTLRTGP